MLFGFLVVGGDGYQTVGWCSAVDKVHVRNYLLKRHPDAVMVTVFAAPAKLSEDVMDILVETQLEFILDSQGRPV